nr:hypothetical protein [Pseudomonas aeruginosa]
MYCDKRPHIATSANGLLVKVDYAFWMKWGVAVLVVRLKKGWTLKLDRKVNDANRAGVWSFHCSESTFVHGMDNLLRHAAIRPAEPAEGKSTEVEVAICRPGDPEEKWIPVGKGVAVYEAER